MSSQASDQLYSTPQWWKEAVVYQVYPSSFQAHAGSTTGCGSIKGIISRLDYLKALGVDVVWSSLSQFTLLVVPSPQVDMGYDISDYIQIDARYGTLDDVDTIIAEVRKWDMKLVLDLVVNHTSDQHPWFLESRGGKNHPKRDCYIWRKGKVVTETGGTVDQEPPNNWAQILGEAGSAWTPEQPDLNSDNPEAPEYDDAEITLDPKHHTFQPVFRDFVNGPKMHGYLQEMHREVLSRYDAITVGEMPWISDESEILRTVGANAGELRMIFIFDLRVMIGNNGWNTVFIENHDNPRSVSRYVDDSDDSDDSDEYGHIGAKLLALMQTTLGGTLFVYQGEEIGMRNIPKEWDVAKEYKDIETINYWNKVNDVYAGSPELVQHGRAVVQMKARDHARTPMNWALGIATA
ncbi:hypothetical protein E0Z10_g7697 [Xylaria hypoxylon]|uniref:Glycosyl hydrolase family 13 catalytic domain-containing protein n=1 Tax=Xylaria hypoxylon TaxID=37992 RepID=A0A4Z0YAW2_9PEZI|nr:hypothetical protein E0Z10_g7697 [Xylaria hypoxylon]